MHTFQIKIVRNNFRLLLFRIFAAWMVVVAMGASVSVSQRLKHLLYAVLLLFLFQDMMMITNHVLGVTHQSPSSARQRSYIITNVLLLQPE